MGLTAASLKRVAKGVPIARMLLVGDIALLLNGAERRRLAQLLHKRARRTGGLDADERAELDEIVAKLQPRLFLGTAARRLSPIRLPARLLYGPRNSSARRAARDSR